MSAESGKSTRKARYKSVYPSESPNPGKTPRFLNIARSLPRGVDSVEHAAVGKMLLLGGPPGTEDVSNREQLDLAELLLVLLGNFGICRAVVVLAHDFLRFWSVQEVEVRLGELLVAMLLHILVHQGDGWLGQDAQRGNHDFVAVLLELFERQQRFVLPCDEYVADVALDEGLGLGFVVAVLLQRVAPRRQIVPTRASGRLGVRGDHLDTVLHQVVS